MNRNKKESDLNLATFTREELFGLRIEIEREMESRGIKFSVGELGEQIAVNFFNSTPGFPNLSLAPTGVKNVDALSRDGHRYSVKTVKKAKKTGTIYPGANDDQLFEFMLIVELDEKYELKSLNRFSWDQFLKARSWDKRMSAWYIPFSSSRLQYGDILFPQTNS